MRNPITASVIAALVLVSWGTPAQPNEDPPQQIVAQILDDWQARQKKVHSIRYKLSGTWFHPKGKFNGGYASPSELKLLAAKGGHVPPKDIYLPHQVDVLLELDRNWARKELQWHVMHRGLAEFVPHRTTHLFNGKMNKTYEPRESNTSNVYTPSPEQPDLLISEGGGGSPVFFQVEDYPIGWACGSVYFRGMVPGSLRSPNKSDDIRFHGFGTIEKSECVILRTSISDPVTQVWREFWVDRARDSAILRCIGYFEGRLDFQIDAKYRIQDGLQLPSSWRCTYYESDSIYQEFDLRADEIVINPSVEESDFDVPLKPGMVVTYPATGLSGVVAQDGQTLLPLSHLGNNQRPSMWRRVALVTLVVLAIAGGAFWLVRRRSRGGWSQAG